MKSDLPKVLHKVAGLEMVNHVVGAAMAADIDRCAVVTGNQRELVEEVAGAANSGVLFF